MEAWDLIHGYSFSGIIWYSFSNGTKFPYLWYWQRPRTILISCKCTLLGWNFKHTFVLVELHWYIRVQVWFKGLHLTEIVQSGIIFPSVLQCWARIMTWHNVPLVPLTCWCWIHMLRLYWLGRSCTCVYLNRLFIKKLWCKTHYWISSLVLASHLGHKGSSWYFLH